MNMVIVLEILGGILVLAAAVRYAVRDTRQRRGVTESEGTGEASLADPHGDERETQQQRPSEVVDQREGEEAAALSASSTAPESPANPR